MEKEWTAIGERTTPAFLLVVGSLAFHFKSHVACTAFSTRVMSLAALFGRRKDMGQQVL
jgi:hypothetical protein